MLLVKLTAGELRQIKTASADPEIMDALRLIKDKIAQSEVLKEMGRVPMLKKKRYNWAQAWDICQQIMGKQLYKPPFPDQTWFIRVNNALNEHGMDDDYVMKLAEYAKERLRSPCSFNFLICQHLRILAGEFDKDKGASPDLTTHQLPED